MPQNSIKINEPALLSPVKKYCCVEVLDKHNSFFWAVMLALLTQPELYSSVPVDLFNQDQVFRDRAFTEVCKKCFASISILEERQIKKLIEQFKKKGELTFIVRNQIFQQGVSFLRKKAEDYFQENPVFFSNFFPDRYARLLKSISISGRFPNEGDIKALAMALNREIVITSSATQARIRYSDSPLSLTTQQRCSEAKKCAIYLEVHPQKDYAFGSVDFSILSEWISQRQQSLPSSWVSQLRTLFVHLSWAFWQTKYKASERLRVFNLLFLQYWQAIKNKRHVPTLSLRDFFLRLDSIEENIASLLLENKRMNLKKSKAAIFFQSVIDSFSELDGYYSAMMMWPVLGSILIPCLPAMRAFSMHAEELAAVSFLSLQKQPRNQYDRQYQEFLIKKPACDSTLAWFISPQTPFRKAFIAGMFGDTLNQAIRKKRIYPLIMFSLLFTFLSCNPDIAQNSAVINMELLVEMLFLIFFGIPYLMEGIETMRVMTGPLFQKTNQVATQTVYNLAGKIRHATCGCFFNTADESENEEIVLEERTSCFNTDDESENEEIFLGDTILSRLFNQADRPENDQIFVEETRAAAALS